jgi:hydrogenase maturation protease
LSSLTESELFSILLGGRRAERNMGAGAILVIGYGNDLRGDDAAGQRAAARVAAWALPGVEVRTLHQLTPELAAPLAEADRAIFLDAHPVASGAHVRVRRLRGVTSPVNFAHACEPHGLLDLSQRVFGRMPDAWWVTIPAVDFAFGAPLSARTEAGIAEALAAVRRLLAPARPPRTVRAASGRPARPRRRRDASTRRNRGCPTR